MKKHFQKVVKEFRDSLPDVNKLCWVTVDGNCNFRREMMSVRPEYPKAMMTAAQIKKNTMTVNFGYKASVEKVDAFVSTQSFKDFCEQFHVKAVGVETDSSKYLILRLKVENDEGRR